MNASSMASPCIIDIEASGFGAESYPIEVGVVTSSGERYCALIKPCERWTHWCASAEKLHGISQAMLLEYGKAPEQVCKELNQLLCGTDVFSDAWSHDQNWLATLYRAAEIVPSFNIRALEFILDEEHLEIWDTVKSAIEQSHHINRHRASSDAYMIQMTYLECLAEKALRERALSAG